MRFHHTLLCLAGFFLLQGTSAAQQGILFYKQNPQRADKFASFIVFSRIELFAHTATVFPANSQPSVRLLRNQITDQAHLPNLKTGTFATAEEVAALEISHQRLAALVAKYPQSEKTLADTMGFLSMALQQLKNGNVLIAGRWQPAAAAPKMGTDPTNELPSDLTFGGRTYHAAKLKGIVGAMASIMHAGGVASIPIDELTQEQIKLLNSTTNLVAIDPTKDYAAMVGAPALPAAPAIGPSSPATETPSVNAEAHAGGWKPTSLDEVADCTLLVTMVKKTIRFFGTAFLCNENGATYIYTNMHNLDGAQTVEFKDQEGNIYQDVEYAEFAEKPWGYLKANGDGGDVVRFKLKTYRPKALTLAATNFAIIEVSLMELLRHFGHRP